MRLRGSLPLHPTAIMSRYLNRMPHLKESRPLRLQIRMTVNLRRGCLLEQGITDFESRQGEQTEKEGLVWQKADG